MESAPCFPIALRSSLRLVVPGVCLQTVCSDVVLTARRAVGVVSAVSQQSVALSFVVDGRLFEAVVHGADGYGQTLVTRQEMKAAVTAATVTSVGRPGHGVGVR